MKKWLLIIIAVTIVLTLIVSGCAASAPSSKVYTLKFAGYRPPAQAIPQQFEIFIQNVKDKSNGQLDIQFHPAGALLKPKEQFTGVADRIADMSSTAPPYHAGEVPLVSACDLVFAYGDYEAGVKTIRGGLGDLLNKEYAKFGIKAVMWYPAGTLDFFSQFPVKAPSDLQGKKVRGAGGLQLMFFELCGASTVQMTAGEIYQAAQTGTIDGFGLTDGTFVSQRLFEVTKYATLMPINIPLGLVIMNEDSYNELPKNLQKIFDNACHDAEEALIKAVQADDAKARDTMKKEGMNVYQLSKAEYEAFKAIGMKTWDSLVTKNPGTSAPEMLKIVEKYNR